MAEIEQPWTKDQILGDSVSKKEIITFLHEHAAKAFLKDHKLLGNIKNILKSAKKDTLLAVYEELFEKKAFVGSEYDTEIIEVTKSLNDMSTTQNNTKKETVEEIPRFKKTVLKKGDKVNFPKRGDMVSCYYVGKLADGTVFDKLQAGTKKKKIQPLKFKVGKGNVIKGWDEALLQMSVGEKAEIIIESVWAYGKQGKPEAKIPPHAELTFEVELVRID